MNEKNDLAPVVLFVYNRLDHTKKTIKALQNNTLAKKTDLFIFSDNAKNEMAEKDVKQVREFIQSIDGFKTIHIIKRTENFGLAKSIISGVTEVINKYEKVIVLEDDLVSSHKFLEFMNAALEYYKNEKKVWHISGWNYTLDKFIENDVFLWRAMNCWGWATWKDRWIKYERNIDKTISDFSKEDIINFSFNNYRDFWKQILDNKSKKINTWAIFWYATIFKNGGLCLNPSISYIKNIGQDGTGTNSIAIGNINNLLNTKINIKFETKIEENKEAIEYLTKYFKSQKKNIITRITNKISRILIKRNLIK
jgi:hypothetical protein